jgi:lysozyme
VIKPSAVAIDLIKRFEGYRRTAARLADGRWTIGYGHTKTAREGAEVSESDAEALLTYDLIAVAAAIEDAVFTPLTQNQVDALASFVFNVGVRNFQRSAVLRRINEGALLDAAFALEIWRKADFEGERIVVDALVRRRAAEKALFLKPQDGWVPAPTPVVEPRADHGLDIIGPGRGVAEVTTPLDGPLTPSHEADDLSPPQRAAAALTERLRALAPEEAEPPSEPEPFPEVADAPLQPGPAPFVHFEPPSAPADPDRLRRAIFGAPEPRPKPEPGTYGPLSLLAGAGLLVFGGAVFAAFRAKPMGDHITPLAIGLMVVGLIGVLCVASAVYFLLEKLSGRED